LTLLFIDTLKTGQTPVTTYINLFIYLNLYWDRQITKKWIIHWIRKIGTVWSSINPCSFC